MENTDKYVSYKIIPELNLIIQYLQGPVEGDDAIHLVKEVRKDNTYNPKYNVLIDFRDIAIDRHNIKGRDSIAKFISFIKEKPELMSGKKISIIFSKPIQAVLSTFLKEDYSAISVSTGLYSTLEAALENLYISPKEIQRVSEEIEKLKNSGDNIL